MAYIADDYERLKYYAELSLSGKDGYQKIMRKFHALQDKAYKEAYKLMHDLEEKKKAKFKKKFPKPFIMFQEVKEKKKVIKKK